MILRYAILTTILTVALGASGCMSLRHRGPVSESVATCRELCCQGVAAAESGQTAQAESLLLRAIEASPADKISRQHLANVLWQRGAKNEALLQIEAAVQLDPTDATLLVRSGEMLLATGAQERALDRANKAVGLAPRLATAWALRGRAYWQTGNPDRALADFQRSLQFAPAETKVLIELAALYRERGQHHRCLTTVHHLLDSFPLGEEPQFVLLLQGRVLADLERWPEARESLVAASKRGTPNVDVFFELAQVELKAGYPAAAQTAARQALVTDGSHGPSRELLAQIASAAQDDAMLR